MTMIYKGLGSNPIMITEGTKQLKLTITSSPAPRNWAVTFQKELEEEDTFSRLSMYDQLVFDDSKFERMLSKIDKTGLSVTSVVQMKGTSSGIELSIENVSGWDGVDEIIKARKADFEKLLQAMAKYVLKTVKEVFKDPETYFLDGDTYPKTFKAFGGNEGLMKVKFSIK